MPPSHATRLEVGNFHRPCLTVVARVEYGLQPFTAVLRRVQCFAVRKVTGPVPEDFSRRRQPTARPCRVAEPMARAPGHRSFQSQQAAAISPMATSQPTPLPDASLAKKDRPPPLALSDNARKALLQFDSRGRLMRWLTRFSMQKLAMWVQWTHFDHRRVCSEREVNEVLRMVTASTTAPRCAVQLIYHQLPSRKPDCSGYRKLAARPDDETRALLHACRL